MPGAPPPLGEPAALDPEHLAVAPLLMNAQRAGTVRTEVRLDTVLALLAAPCHEAVDGGWDADPRDRTLAVVFAGLRPPG